MKVNTVASEAGRLLGSIKSPRKALAVRKNGLLGGRPRSPLFQFWEYRRQLRLAGFTPPFACYDKKRLEVLKSVGTRRFEAVVSRLSPCLRRCIVRDAELI